MVGSCSYYGPRSLSKYTDKKYEKYIQIFWFSISGLLLNQRHWFISWKIRFFPRINKATCTCTVHLRTNLDWQNKDGTSSLHLMRLYNNILDFWRIFSCVSFFFCAVSIFVLSRLVLRCTVCKRLMVLVLVLRIIIIILAFWLKSKLVLDHSWFKMRLIMIIILKNKFQIVINRLFC